MNDQDYMKEAYKEALKSLEYDDVPVGAIIVYNNQIIARAYNQREKDEQAIHHAEILAIQQACNVLHSWRLDDCILYVTLEPCLMCSGAIIQSHIKKVVYGASSDKWISLKKISYHSKFRLNYKPKIIGHIMEEECSSLIKKYFKNKRS